MQYDSQDLIKPFPKNYGVGLQFKDDRNILYKTVCNYPRRVTTSISSFVGISPEAVHYYARLISYGLGFKVLKIPNKKKQDRWGHKVGDIVHISGAFDKYIPEEAQTIEILIRRKLTKKEISTERFETYQYGDYTDCYNTLSTLKRHIKKHFNRLFGDGWILINTRF